MPKRLFIFDLDGTVLNTLDDLTDSVNITLSEFGLPNRNRAEIASFTGEGIQKLIARSAGSKEKGDEIFPYFKEYYFSHCNIKTKPYDGILSLLQSIRSKNGCIAVLSNKADEAVQTLVHRHFPHAVDFALGMKDGLRSKPFPDGAEVIMRLFGIEKEDAVLIGDSEIDILTARSAKITSVAATWGFRTEKELIPFCPDAVVRSPSEIEIVTGI